MDARRKIAKMEKKMVASHRGWKRWQRVISLLACVVMFITTYGMILPAITMTTDAFCGLEEHAHDDSCVTRELVCGLEGAEDHTHGPECYHVEQELTCEAHVHTPECYTEVTNVCELEEGSGAHSHTDECYEMVERSCGQEVSDGHVHTEECNWTERGKLTCSQEENEGHVHSNACSGTHSQLTCTEPDHEHNADCYIEKREQICPIHVHDDGCYQESYTCGLEAHEHTLMCHSNPEAGKTAALWEAKVPAATGDWAADLLATAKSQLGYVESTENFQVDEEEKVHYYSIYGDAVGYPYDEWSGAFITWCLRQAKIPNLRTEEQTVIVPRAASTSGLMDAMVGQSLFRDKDSYEAKPGDLVFYKMDDKLEAALFEEYLKMPDGNGGEVTVALKLLQGDVEGEVAELGLYLEDIELLGYAELPLNPQQNPPLDDQDEDIDDEENVDEDETGVVGSSSIDEYYARTDLPFFAVASTSGELRNPGIMLMANYDDPVHLGDSTVEGSGYISEKKVEYYDPVSKKWIVLKVGSTLPSADVMLRVSINFDTLDKQLLINHGYTVMYDAENIVKLPNAIGDILREDDAGNLVKCGAITASYRDVGEGQQNTVYLNFTDHEWVNTLQEYVDSKFYYQGRLDLSQLGKDEYDMINLAGIEIKVPDAADAAAHFGEATITKEATKKPGTNEPNIIREGNNFFVEYTLTVKTEEYGMPAMRVIDRFTQGTGKIHYVGVSGAAAECTATDPTVGPVENVSPASSVKGQVYLTNDTAVTANADPTQGGTQNLAWVIGAMGPNETRTLTYRVQLDDSYVGIIHNNNKADADKPLKNAASLTSKQYDHGTSYQTVTPKLNAGIQKTGVLDEVDSEDGNRYATFLVKVTANADNTFPIKNVKVWDHCNNGTSFANLTVFDQSSLKVYKTTVAPENLVTSGYTLDVTGNNKFDLFLGSMEPGDVYWVEYRMGINVDNAIKQTSGAVGLYNTAEVYSTGNNTNDKLGQSSKNFELDRNTWLEKLSGPILDTAKTVDMEGMPIYDGTQSGIPAITVDKPAFFIAPVGAQEYKVAINKEGNWNVASAEWKDELGASADGRKHMKFTGYVRVDLYDTVTGTNSGNIQGQNNDGTTTPRKTAFVKVHDLFEFNFNGSDIGMNEQGAFLLTYYAAPFSDDISYGKAKVGNTFNFGGDVVGPDGTPLTINSMSARVTVETVEPGTIEPIKQSWDYVADDPDFNKYHGGESNNGAIYWVIKVSGDKIPAGIQFLESTRVTNDITTYIRNSESYLGFYLIDFPNGTDNKDNMDEFFAEFPTYQAFKDAQTLNPERFQKVEDLTGVELRYDNMGKDTKYGDNGDHYDLYFQFPANVKDDSDKIIENKDVLIPSGKALYLLMKTDPVTWPDTGKSVAFNNKIAWKHPASLDDKWPNDAATYEVHMPEAGLKKTVANISDGNAAGIFRVSNNGATIEYYNKAEKVYKDYFATSDYRTPSSGNVGCNATFLTNKLKNNMLLKSNDRSHSEQYSYEDGTYLIWNVTINQDGTMAGNNGYIIEDTLPDHVELAYVRTAYLNSNNSYYDNQYKVKFSDNNAQRKMIAAYDTEQKYTKGWQEHTILSSQTNGTYSWAPYAAAYYTQGNKVRLYIPVVQGNNSNGNDRVTFQVVCRVTDDGMRNLSFGDEEFVNTAQLLDTRGRRLDGSTSVITMSGGTINKQLLFDQIQKKEGTTDILISTKFPYSIEINAKREDMVPNSDIITIPLVDRMSAGMTPNLTTLKIYVLADDEQPSDNAGGNLVYYGGLYSDAEGDSAKAWYSADPANLGKTVGNIAGKNTNIQVAKNMDAANEISFHNLPDQARILIKYDVTVTATNGTSISANNKAFWEGYENNQGGESDVKELQYEAQASAGTTGHGALLISKFDADDQSKGLKDAWFAFFRAEYVECSEGMIYEVPKDGTIDDIKLHVKGTEHILAVYQDMSDGHQEEIATARSTADNSIIYLQVITSDNQRKWMPLSEAKSYGSFSHQLELDDQGNIQPCHHTVHALAVGKTDANGKVSYGFGAPNDFGTLYNPNELTIKPDGNYELSDMPTTEITYTETDADRIHFNKIYIVEELIAPEGYQRSTEKKAFVMPNPDGNYNGGNNNYFYHPNTWPSSVTWVKSDTRYKNETTFFYDVPNNQIKLHVTKDFGGSKTAYKPGSYTVGIWNGALAESEVTKENVLDTVTFTYTADDFGSYNDPATGEQCYGLLPEHEQSLTFSRKLALGNYRLYEIGDDGEPIKNVTGEVNGLNYSVSVNGDDSGEIIYGNVNGEFRKDFLVRNTSYAVEMTKNFVGLNGDVLTDGITGTYSFGLWDTLNAVGAPEGKPIMTKHLTWDVDDTAAEKKIIFSGLAGNTDYYVFELDDEGKPVTPNGTGEFQPSPGTLTKYLVKYTWKGTEGVLTTADGTTTEVKLSNTATVALPHTGGMGTKPIYLMGVVMMCLASVAYVLQNSRKKQKN